LGVSFEFEGFLLDGACRELRFQGRDVPLQPRVFDVLMYLVTHRDRVVRKEELLDAVWPGVIVTDGSLKRAVSLARSALREGGIEDAIRTYSRQGYRFDVASVTEHSDDAGPMRLSHSLEGARTLFSEGRWSEAAAAFEDADRKEALQASDLERWAEAAQVAGRVREAIAPLERAVAAHGAVSDARGVARAATTLALIHFEHMELSTARGWLQRAATVLPGSPLTREHGYHAGLSSRFAVGAGDFNEAAVHAERAIAIGRELADVDIELLGMNYLGMALVAGGDVHRGHAIHDETAAIALSGAGTASPIIGGLVYCGLIWTCRNRGDWQRASEWTQSYTRWCERRSVELYSGSCRLHHAEVLHHRGEFDAAEREAKQACQDLSTIAPYAEGDAYRVLGDLRLSQGDLDAAEEAFRRAHGLGWDPQPGLAQVMIARGRPAAGLKALERSLHDARWTNQQRRPLLLANVVAAALAASEPDRARTALAELEAERAELDTPWLAALFHSTRAETLVSAGDVAASISDMREAIEVWQRMGAQLHVARQRLRLAEVYVDEEDDTDAAELELSAARRQLAELGLETLCARCDALMSRLARKGDTPAV
jgi:DNA-binding winged helix-turn-helix (wHTH) protein